MIRKSLYLYIVISILLLLFSALSGFADAAVAPVSTPLGYITLHGSAPARIATDGVGKIYVTNANRDSFHVYSNNGVLLSTFYVNNPLGIAVDLTGRVFAGSMSEGSVSVFNSQGNFLYKLGSGNGEFALPNDIAISLSGIVYVTDSINNLVKAYNLDGTFLFSFNSALNFPTGIAVDDTAGEVYVSDQNNGVIKIFDLNGGYRRFIRGGTRWNTVFIRPQGIALDSTRIYIADAYNSAIVVYGKDGVFLKYMGNYGEDIGEFKTPLDIAFDKDGKAFITNHNNSRIEIIGIDNFAQLNVKPNTLSFSLFETDSPASERVQITSSGSASGWTATTSDSWITVSPLAGTAGTTPSDVNITVDPRNLGAGNKTGQVMFATPSGTTTIVQVNLEVKSRQSLEVAPTSVSLKYYRETLDYPSGNISIASTGGSLTWNSVSGAGWLSLSSTAGTTPANIKLSINEAAKALSTGTYSSQVTIDAGNVKGSPAIVNVQLKVVTAGIVKVKSNLKEAAFEITGAASYSGSGLEWINDEAPLGSYTIAFKHVTGYIKPATRTFRVQAGKETVLDGTYRAKQAATNIIAGSGGEGGNSLVVISLADRSIVTSLTPFSSSNGVMAAAGDLAASGLDKIVVTDNKRSIKIYTPEGLLLASLDMPEWYRHTVLAVGDVDNDGKAEIIVGTISGRHTEKEQVVKRVKKTVKSRGFLGKITGRKKTVTETYTTTEDVEKGPQRVIKLFSYADGKLTDKGAIFTESKSDKFSIAVGDINGDGWMELVAADGKGVRAFTIDTSSEPNQLRLSWTLNSEYGAVPEVAAGDINDDGISEIALSVETAGEKGAHSGTIKMLKGTGEDYGLTIEAYKDLGYAKPSRVALGDINSDNKDEIITGAGPDEKNEPLIRMFDSTGALTGETIKAMDGKYGVNVGLGRFK